MRTVRFIVVPAVLLLGVLAWAGDKPWEKKPYRDWTERDVAEVLGASPWARLVQATGAWRPIGTQPQLEIWQDPHVGTTQADNAINPADPQLYTVLWASSRTVRAALARRSVLQGSAKQEAAEQGLNRSLDAYMILVRGSSMAIFEKRGEAAFAKAAYMQLKKGKRKLLPSRVTFFRSDDGHSVTGAVFYFSKKEANISADESEVAFFLQVGEFKFLTSFDPRRMIDAQGQDL
jgi:hypothetical protein